MEEDIKQCLKVLREGGIIAYPTDTVWGLGCDATNPIAVEKIYKLKQRENSQSMLVLIESDQYLGAYVDIVPNMAYTLIEISDKPLTIIYQNAKNLASNLISEDGSIGIRVVKDPFCELLLSKFQKPIVSTSANIHGQPTPAFFKEISEEILNGVDYVAKWRRNDLIRRTPSSIISLGAGGEIKIIRK